MYLLQSKEYVCLRTFSIFFFIFFNFFFYEHIHKHCICGEKYSDVCVYKSAALIFFLFLCIIPLCFMSCINLYLLPMQTSSFCFLFCFLFLDQTHFLARELLLAGHLICKLVSLALSNATAPDTLLKA